MSKSALVVAGLVTGLLLEKYAPEIGVIITAFGVIHVLFRWAAGDVRSL